MTIVWVVFGYLLAYFFLVKPYPAKKQANHPLSEKSKVALRGTPCEAVETVEEFNDCAAESFAEQL